jgi:hypothetical protein
MGRKEGRGGRREEGGRAYLELFSALHTHSLI